MYSKRIERIEETSFDPSIDISREHGIPITNRDSFCHPLKRISTESATVHTVSSNLIRWVTVPVQNVHARTMKRLRNTVIGLNVRHSPRNPRTNWTRQRGYLTNLNHTSGPGNVIDSGIETLHDKMVEE
jgi:hypothetical protein